MSRTKRNYPTWIDWVDGYDKKLQRDNHSIYPIQTADGLWGEEVWGQKGKKHQKKLRARKRRRQKIDEAA